jgi:hypothetical protein
VEVVLTAQQPVPTWERGPTRQALPTDTDSIIDVIGAKHKKHKRSKDPTCLLILAGLGSTLQGFLSGRKSENKQKCLGPIFRPISAVLFGPEESWTPPNSNVRFLLEEWSECRTTSLSFSLLLERGGQTKFDVQVAEANTHSFFLTLDFPTLLIFLATTFLLSKESNVIGPTSH